MHTKRSLPTHTPLTLESFDGPGPNQHYACIGLQNPKSPENVGSVMRAAGCYSANSVFYTGNRYDKAKQYHTDTQKAYEKLPLIRVDQLQDVLPFGCVPVAVDLIEGAKPLPTYRHPPRAFYIFGPEDGTLNKSITQFCSDTIYIPTQGSMNLAATVNVVLYDRLSKGDDFSYHQEALRV